MESFFWIGIMGLVAILACWSLAIVLFRVSIPGSVARKLGVLLIIEGLVLVSAGFPEFVLQLPESVFEQYAWVGFFLGVLHHGGDAAMLALYPPFLAMALDTRITRVFVTGKAQIVLAIFATLLAVWVVASNSRIALTTLYATVTLLFIYALIASIHAWRTAQTASARERAAIFALAFGLRDLGWSISYAIAAWTMWANVTPESSLLPFLWMKSVYALGTLLAVPLIAYGILRSHLFDIDLRIRWTIKQSTVGVAIFAIVFIVSEGAEQLLSDRFGSYWGLLAAAIIAVALRPLQKFGEKVASAAMPNTHNTEDYKTGRKREVYESAIADAFQDGDVTERERLLLNHLRESLGISAAEAMALEKKALA